ncbi:MAG TPA: apolipoprotein N-acyltransferase [Terriglobales bacterium]|nr:apolipoprotein N-acyltransferase [Terriglobales bacterium]
MPWYLGDALALSPLLRQGADLGGVQGLSFAIALCAAALVQTAAVGERRRRDGNGWRRLSWLGLAAVVVLSMLAYGYNRLGAYSETNTDFEVAVIQSGQGSRDNLPPGGDAWATYLRLTVEHSALRGGHRPDAAKLTVWPETVLRSYPAHDAQVEAQLTTLARHLDHPLVVGALDRAEDGRERNSAFLIDSDGISQRYHKRRLVAFAEAIPAAGSIPFAQRWRLTGRFAAGEGFALMDLTASVRAAVLICFEAIHAGAYLEEVRGGARLLLNLTDDSWFENAAEAQIHLNATVMRAVELRRWLVRTSGSGISAFVDPKGEVVASLPLFTAGALQHGVELRHELSPYARFGEWPLAFAAAALLAAWVLRRGRCDWGAERAGRGDDQRKLSWDWCRSSRIRSQQPRRSTTR